jgi:hypothetical protein
MFCGKNISMVAQREKHLQNSIKELSHEMDWTFIGKVLAARFQMLLLFLIYFYICLVVIVKLGWINYINTLF